MSLAYYLFMKRIKKYKVRFVFFLGFFASLSGFAFVNDYFQISRNIEIFTTVYRELTSNYVDSIPPDKLMKTAIDGMLNSLDPYTNYIPESESDDYRFMTTGVYGGIGSTITQIGNQIMIAEPYENFPAYNAGLMSGDVILSIDGKSMFGANTSTVSKLLKGAANTEVKLRLQRMGELNEIEKVILRQEIKIKNIQYSALVDSGIAYIKLAGFTQNAGRELRDAIRNLKSKNTVSSIILDLRDNPGGLLHEAINVSNIFIPKGELVVNTKGKVEDANRAYKAINDAEDVNIPLVVLTNNRSASASEIVAGVIQDLDRGVIIGQKSFGKGLVQTTRSLSYRGQLKVTTAKYYIPSGRCIQALNYSGRNLDGSVDKFPDSLKKAFKTRNNRIVYDGGGIEPDIKIEKEARSKIAQSLIDKRLTFEYANFFKSKKANIVAAKSFQLSDLEYLAFVQFLKNKDYDYKTRTEQLLAEYKVEAEKENYYASIDKEYLKLKIAIAHDKEADLIRYRDEIKTILVPEIASKYYPKGRLEASFKDDGELIKAIELLRNPKEYRAILKN